MLRYFKRDISALNDVFRFTAEFVGARRIGKSVSFAMDLAVDELFTNIIKHAAPGSNDISVDLDVVGKDLVIKITDFDVERFDITETNSVDVSKSLDDREAGGIGLHLVRNIVDDVTFEYWNRTACITLIKHMEDPDV
jgi:serine/threonine-protein kinase RsbW